jgi:excisionase family DNA binding protein
VGDDEAKEYPDVDNQGNPVDWNVVFKSWLKVTEAAEIMGVVKQNVSRAAQDGRVRAIKIGGAGHGEWRIEPTSAKQFERYKHKR